MRKLNLMKDVKSILENNERMVLLSPHKSNKYQKSTNV
jgi:hypothetical protein